MQALSHSFRGSLKSGTTFNASVADQPHQKKDGSPSFRGMLGTMQKPGGLAEHITCQTCMIMTPRPDLQAAMQSRRGVSNSGVVLWRCARVGLVESLFQGCDAVLQAVYISASSRQLGMSVAPSLLSLCQPILQPHYLHRLSGTLEQETLTIGEDLLVHCSFPRLEHVF